MGEEGTERVIFITNRETGNDNTRSGERDSPLTDLQNGLSKGIEILAPFPNGNLTIYLYSGDHYLLLNYTPYIPLNKLSNAHSYSITIK